MSTGKVKIEYVPMKEMLVFNEQANAEIFENKELRRPDLNQILLISESLNQNFKYVHCQPFDDVTFDLFHRVIEIHLFLSKEQNLSNSQKLDYCQLERYFMKKYLNEIVRKTYSK